MAIEVAYTHDFNDFRTLINGYRAKRKLDGSRRLLFLGVVLSAAAFVLSGQYQAAMAAGPVNVIGWFLVLLLAVMPVLWLIDIFFDRVVYRWIYSRQPGAHLPLKLKLSDDAIEWTAPGRNGRLEWSLIKSAYKEPQAFVLFVGGREGIVLPRRAFDDPAAFDAAYNFAMDQVNASK